VAFDEERDEGVEFVERIENAEEVAGVTVSCDGEEVS
jgi:hypothetical protein